jgi:hypothetical protein
VSDRFAIDSLANLATLRLDDDRLSQHLANVRPLVACGALPRHVLIDWLCQRELSRGGAPIPEVSPS